MIRINANGGQDMKQSLILLSGGVGSRMNNPVPKQYLLLAGKPMIMHILERVSNIQEIDSIIIVCVDEYIPSIKLMLEQYGINKKVVFAPAGNTRQASVFSGLQKVETESVIIHEAARPFVPSADFIRLINDPNENSMFGLGIPFTIIKGHDYVEGLLTRSELVNVQLPQKFNTKLLLKAHKKAIEDGKRFTEDVSLLYYYNKDLKVRILEGREYNLKITTRTDMLVGEVIYDEYFRRRK